MIVMSSTQDTTAVATFPTVESKPIKVVGTTVCTYCNQRIENKEATKENGSWVVKCDNKVKDRTRDAEGKASLKEKVCGTINKLPIPA